MTTSFAIALADEIVQRLDPASVLQAIDFHADKVQEAGGTLKAFCPIHQDSRFRSLLIDGERGAFRCTIKSCRGYGGGSLLDLYALSRNLTALQAAWELVERLQIELGEGWQGQLTESYLSEATSAIDRGDYTDAETLLRELLSIMPALPDARIMLASVMAELGNFSAASEEYIRLIDNFLSQGMIAEAAAAADDATQRFPENEELLFIQVKVAEAQGDGELALARMRGILDLREALNRHLDNVGLLEQLTVKHPEEPEFALKLAALYEQQHNLRGAARQFENAANQFLKSGDKAQGIELLEKVLQYNGENTRARLDLARELVEAGELDKARSQTFRVINQQIDQQEYGRAVTTINNWMEQEPESIESREMLARVYQDQARIDEAAAQLAEGAELASKAGDHKRAADLLLRAKFVIPDDVDLRRRLIGEFQTIHEDQRAAFEIIDLAEILFSADDRAGASELLSQSVAMDISLQLKLQMVASLASHGIKDRALGLMGDISKTLGPDTPAEEVADFKATMVELEPDDVAHRLEYLDALLSAAPDKAAEAAVEGTEHFLAADGVFEANQILEKICTGLESYVPATGRLVALAERCDRMDLAGRLYQVSIEGFAERDPEAALKAARRIAELDPNHPSAPSDIAYLLAMLGRTEEAATQYAEVADLLRLAGDLETALQYAREGTGLDPGNVLALSTLTLLARELLSPEETDELGAQLLALVRQTADTTAASQGYLAYSEVYPNEIGVLEEAAERLKEANAGEALARIQARHAYLLSAEGDLAGAKELLEKAISAAPELADIHYQHGQTLIALGEPDGAACALAKAAADYKALGLLDAAMRSATEAYDAGPESMEAWETLFRGSEAAELTSISARAAETLTKAYSETGPQSTVARWAREWVRLAATNAEAHRYLADALLAIDQKDNASTAYSTAAALYRDAGELENVIAVLQAAADAKLFTKADFGIASSLEEKLTGGPLKTRALVLAAQVELSRNDLSAARGVAERIGAEPEAAKIWSRISRQEPDPAKATAGHLNAAKILEQHGATEEAVAELNAAVALSPDHFEVIELLARLLGDAGRTDEALPWQLKVVARMAMGSDDGLPALLQELRTTHQSSVDALTRLGRALVVAGLPDEALKDLEAAAELAGKRNDAAALVTICGVDEALTRKSVVLTRARADSLMGMENVEQALEWVRSRSRELVAAGNAGEAVEMAQKWISLAPADAAAYKTYAEACEAAGNEQCALDARLSLTKLLLESGDVSGALNEIQIVTERGGTTPAVLRLKVDIHKAKKDDAGASQTLTLLSDMYRENGDEAGALAAIEESIALRPDNHDALRKYADLVREMQSVSAALTLYRQWFTAAKEAASAAEQVLMLEEVLTFAPDSVWVLRESASALLETGRYTEAASRLSHLAFVLETEGDYIGAAQVLEQAAAHKSAVDPKMLLEIASLYEQANAPSSAQEHLRQTANLLMDAGKAGEAAGVLDRVIKLSGDAVLPEDLALAAKANAMSGKAELAESYIGKALNSISRISGNRSRREGLLAQALDIAPLNVDYILQHMELLPQNRAMTEGLRKARELNAVERPEDAVRVLSQVIVLAPHDMSVRQELFVPLRQTGNTNRLRQELMAVAADAIAAGDTDAAIEALDEAETIAQTAAHHRALAELNERARRTDKAAEGFTIAAVLFAEDGKTEQAVANVNRAVSARPSAVPTEQMAKLVKLVGGPVLDVAREQLRSALTARRQKQSQTLALALLEAVDPERRPDILKTVNSLGGSTFAVGISQRWTNQLLEQHDMASALQHAASLVEISPDSPDAWHLAAKVYLAVDMPGDARRCAVEAARLFQTAGAVIEEEDSYRLALQAEPDNMSVKASLAEHLVREHREDEAVSLLKQIIDDAEAGDNSDLLLEYLERAVQVAPGNTDLREKLATELQKFAPDSAIENWLEAGRLYMAQGELERAYKTYKHVLRLNPGNETALQELVVHSENSGDLVSAAKYTSALATVKASRKNVGEAVRVLQNYLKHDEDNVAILEQLASLSGTSNNAEVFSATTRALAQKHQKTGNYAEAIHHYELLLERNPKDSKLLMTLLDCSAAAGLQDKGALYARHLLTLARETEDPERVRYAATIILNYDDGDAVAHKDLAEALLSLNKVQEAVAEWMRAAELFEGNGNTAAAYTCYRQVTQLNAGVTQAWKRMADLALTIGDVESARNALMQVQSKTTEAKDAERLSHLVSRLLHALPDDVQMHEAALQIYKQMGDTEKAAEQYVWLITKTFESGNEQQAETLLDEALQYAALDDELKHLHYDFIRRTGRLEELQLRLRKEAEQHEAAGDIAQATQVLYELAVAAPGQIAVHRDLSRLLEDAGRFEESLEQQLEIVKILLQKGDLEEARETADELAAKHKKDSRAKERIADVLAASPFPDIAARHYMAAARIAESKKDQKRAIELYTKATIARPLWTDAHSALADACEAVGEEDLAFNALVSLTSILLDEGDFSQATKILDRLARMRPQSPDVRVQLASLYEKTGNREQQAATLRELAALYEENGQENESLEVYRKLASIDPDDPTLLSRYVELLSLHGEVNAEELTEEYARLAEVLAQSGDVEGALQTYEQVVGVNPENTSARSRYAAFLLGRGSRNKALMEMRALANLYMERGEPPAAVEVLNAALGIAPRDADLCLALAAAQEAAGFTEEARVSYARASAILASTAAVKGIDTYRRILTQDENNTAVRLRLVELLLNSGDKNEAAREARTLAEIHISRGELVEAEKAYRFVDQCEPESVEEIQMAIKRDSYDPSLQYVHYVRLGNVLYECGDIDKALDAYRTARSLHDDQPEIIQKCIECVSLIAPEAEAITDYLLLAEKLMLAGDLHQARQTYEKVRLVDPFNNDAKCGLESVNAAERARGASQPGSDDMVLKTNRAVSKRVALRDLLVACQHAVDDPGAGDSQRLGS